MERFEPPEAFTTLALALVLCLVFITALWFIALKLVVLRKTRELRKELAEQVKLRELSDASNSAKATFLATMSHEIRTPMNAIVGFTDLALKTNLNPELRDYLDTVRTSAEWLMHIINDVLEFSRIEAGGVHLENAEFSLAECVRSALKIVQPEAVAKGLMLRAKIDPQIPAVCGDATKLRQVIFNLLENGVKFTSSGSVMLTAALEAKSSDAVLVRISVADTGIGIPPQKREFIFEPFLPSDDPANVKFGGPGLGLAIARRLVTLMGGTIEFQSQLGAGSTFEFTAWFQKQKLSANIDEPESNAERHPHKNLSILIAEDNAVNRRLITKVLESAGHRVTPVVNGKDAAKMFEMEIFDLILMDVGMPSMDGLEATQAIRAIEPTGSHIPIYAITAHTSSGDRDRCFNAGMDGFITKPIDVNDVLRLVRAVTATPSAPEPVETY